MNNVKQFFNSKEIKNAGWLIAGKIGQMVISFVVGVMTARYLGPDNYGLVNYGLAYSAFFAAIANLGINSVLLSEIIKRPKSTGVLLGTSFFFQLLSGALCSLLILLIVSLVDFNEPNTVFVVALCSLSLVFQASEIFNFWFQSKYESKFVSISTLIAYVSTAVYKIVLLVLGKGIYWFAFANSLDILIYGLIIYLFFLAKRGPKLRVDFSVGKELLKLSYHYILASAMIAIYMQTDKFMLKQMSGDSEVGLYSIASNLCVVWAFILTAIIDSVLPTIFKLNKEGDAAGFIRKNKQLYCFVFYVSVFVSLIFLFFGDFIVAILYGDAYAGSGSIMNVLTWCTVFSYLGVARNGWIICREAQKYLKYMYIFAALANVALNFTLIPYLGAIGAAFASLVTQFCTCFIFPLLFKKTKENPILMIKAILFIGVF